MPKKRQTLQSAQNLPTSQGPQPDNSIVDITAIKPFLVDLPEGGTRGMLSAQPGFDAVLREIKVNQAEFGDEAGITSGDFAALQNDTDMIAQIDTYLPAARKMVEVLEESRAKYDDHRQRIVYASAEGVERRAKSHDDGGTLLAKYQKTREYRSAIGLKAAKTRRRNAAQGGEPLTDPDAPPATVPEPTPPATTFKA